MTRVRLEQFPAALFGALDEASEGLFREYMLLLASGGEPFTPADVAMAADAKIRVAHAVAHAGPGPTLVIDVSDRDAASFAVLQAVLDHVNRLAHDEQMLAMPVLPEIAALRNWICDQVSRQVNGLAGTPWNPPWAGSPTVEPGRPIAPWPQTASLDQAQAWLVGDRRNRIIGATPAALDLLGWDDGLIGERIIAVVPPQFRERHIAAFTRGTVNDQRHLLGQPLSLQALTRSGDSIPVTLTLTTRRDRGGLVYLARLDRR